MSKEITTRTIQVVTAEFVAIKTQVTRMILDSAIEMGRRLCEAKMMLNHGEWGKWLQESAEISQGTANNLMRVFEEYGEAQGSLFGAEANSQTFGNLTYSKAVALLAVPADEREDFAEEVDAESLSTRELQRAIKERNEAVEAKMKAEQEAAEKEAALAEVTEKITGFEAELQNIENEKAELAAKLEEIQNTEPAPASPAEPDQNVIDAAVKEAAETAKKEAEEELKKKIAKAEDAKVKAEKAKAQAEEELNAKKAEYEKNAAAAEQEKKMLSDKIEKLQKDLTISGSADITSFKLHFETAQTAVNKMLECMERLIEGEGKTKLGSALWSFCNAVMGSLPDECAMKPEEEVS